MLIVLAGLPASGKSTIARALAVRLPAAVVAVDPIDDAMRRAGIGADQPTGLAAYMVAEAVAEDVLAAGLPVVVDAVNAVEPARQQWRRLAARRGVPMVVVEVVCPDPGAHRRRLEGRSRGLTDLPEPTWDHVSRRAAEYEPWTEPVLRLDSALPVDANVEVVLRELAGPDRR
ncbi:AAA family ATPase [Pseudonocardia sp.]|jgi:predicted kinase|uniref:AAA family ATPase n=1 Tax=Pseudonocardia sp. TaxID=60912 RepID=UPI002DA4B951|nr:AAA family ATPase [Pseudonocardia sp.]